MFEMCEELLKVPDINLWADNANDATKRKFLVDIMTLK